MFPAECSGCFTLDRNRTVEKGRLGEGAETSARGARAPQIDADASVVEF